MKHPDRTTVDGLLIPVAHPRRRIEKRRQKRRNHEMWKHLSRTMQRVYPWGMPRFAFKVFQ